MQILFTSDLHGLESAYIRFTEVLAEPPYSLGVLSGDLSTGFRPEEFEAIRPEEGIEAEDLLEELHSPSDRLPVRPNRALLEAARRKEARLKEILSSAGKPVLFIMGNDDGLMGEAWQDQGPVRSVNERRIEIGGYGFVGYQYTNPFVGGLFEKTERQQKKDLRILRRLIDSKTILVTHGPAYGFDDFVGGNLKGDQHGSLGSRPLKSLLERSRPRFHLHGHIHDRFGIFGNTINGAYPNVRKFVAIDLASGEAAWVD